MTIKGPSAWRQMALISRAVQLSDAAEMLGMPEGAFAEFVLPGIRIVKISGLLFVPLSELQLWIEANAAVVSVSDAWDEPDTGIPPCDFCRRRTPCECMSYVQDGGPITDPVTGTPGWSVYPERCMCSCGRCMA